MKRLLVAAMASLAMLSFARADEGTGPEIANVGEKGAVTYQDKKLTVANVAEGYQPIVFVDGEKVSLTEGVYTVEGTDPAKIAVAYVKNTAWYLDPFVKNDFIYSGAHGNAKEVGDMMLGENGNNLFMAISRYRYDTLDDFSCPNGMFQFATASLKNYVGSYYGTPVTATKRTFKEKGYIACREEAFRWIMPSDTAGIVLVGNGYGGDSKDDSTLRFDVPVVYPYGADWGDAAFGGTVEGDARYRVNNSDIGNWFNKWQRIAPGAISSDGKYVYVVQYPQPGITKVDIVTDENGKVTALKPTGVAAPTYVPTDAVPKYGVIWDFGSVKPTAIALKSVNGSDCILVALNDGTLAKLGGVAETTASESSQEWTAIGKIGSTTYRNMMITGVDNGTPHLVCSSDTDDRIDIYALTADCSALVSETPIASMKGAGLFAEKVQSFAMPDDEETAYANYWQTKTARMAVITAKPAQVTVRGTFTTYEEGVDTMINYRGAAEVPFAAPAGYVINSVKVNGAAVAGWTPATSYTFTDEALAKNVFIEMTTEVDPAVAEAKIGDTYYLTLREAVLAAQDGQTVTVLKDCRGKNGTAMDKTEWPATAITASFTLDLNGCLVSIDGADRYAITVGDGATLTITDSSEDGEGELRNTGYMSPFILVKETGATGSHLVLNRGRITSTCATYNNRLIRIDDDYDAGSSFTMNGGEVSSPSTASAVIKSWYNSLTTINGGKVTGSVEANGSVEGAVVIPADSTALFDRDQTAFCATGYVTDEHGENEGDLAGWWFVTAGPKVAITYDYGTGTAPETANKADFAAYAADRTFTLAQPTAPTGMKFKAWTADGEGITFAGDVMTIPANFATAFTVTATYEDAAVDPEMPIPSTDPAGDAAKMNNPDGSVKPECINAPCDMGTDAKAAYAKLFTAVPGAGVVTIELNEAGTNAVEEAEQSAGTAALDAVLGAEGDTAALTVVEPLAGFFYSLKQSAAIESLGFKVDGDKNKLGGRDTISFTLDKSAASGFYQMIVSPVPEK